MTRDITVPQAAVPAPRHPRTGRLTRYDRFTEVVGQRCSTDPGARSALRSGVGKDLDSVPRMHQVIAHLVPPAANTSTQLAYYAVAAMIADQARREQSPPIPGTTRPEETDGIPVTEPSAEKSSAATVREDHGTSLGATFAAAVAASPGRERTMRRGTAESRLNILCKQQVAGLHRHLPASVRYLRSLDVPVDYGRLLQDLLDWPRGSGRITRRWLQDFYRALQEEDRRQAEAADLETAADPALASRAAAST